MTDPIADFITRIRNASAVGKEMVAVSYSKIKEEIANLLTKEGYLNGVAKKGKKVNKSLEVVLAYDEFGPKVKGAVRVSKLSKRIYSGARDLRSVKQGHGIAVITTSKGLMTDSEARKQKIGGEILFKVW
jgi:small subunit ribosomal protein S8